MRNKEELLNIDSKTNVPLFATIGAIGILLPLTVKAVMWISQIDDRSMENTRKVDAIVPLVQETHDAVIRLETRFGTQPKVNR